MIGGLPGLDGKGVDDAVEGNYEDAEVSKQYREFEQRRGYRIEPAADNGLGSL
jgi:cell filamentation protein